MMNTKTLLVCGMVLFVIVNTMTLCNSHGLDDDFSQYLKHAQNIVEHKAYLNGIGIEPGVICPPGFPLLLAPLIKCFGFNFAILKIPNLFYWLIYVFALYQIWRKRVGERLAVWLAIFFLTSPVFFIFKQELLSDLPFLCFLTMALSFFDRYAGREDSDPFARAPLIWIASTSLLLAFIIRPAAITLYLAVLLFFTVIKRDLRVCLATLASLAVGWGILAWFDFSFSKNLSEVTVSVPAWIKLCGFNVATLSADLWNFFVPSILPDTAQAFLFETFKMPWISPAINVFFSLGIFVIFLWKMKSRTISLLGCFFAVYYFLAVAWWVPGPGRYILPIVGLLPVYFYEYFVAFYEKVFFRGFKIFRCDPKKIVLLVVFLLILNNLAWVGANFRYKRDEVSRPEFQQMVAWVKANTPQDARFMSYRPRPLGFFTGRLGAGFRGHPEEESLTERVIRLRIQYLIILQGNEDGILRQINPLMVSVHEVWRNSEYIIFVVENTSVLP